jgi:hypothetical protein
MTSRTEMASATMAHRLGAQARGWFSERAESFNHCIYPFSFPKVKGGKLPDCLYRASGKHGLLA